MTSGCSQLQLWRFPFIVIDEILRAMGPYELHDLSLTSKRAWFLVKSLFARCSKIFDLILYVEISEPSYLIVSNAKSFTLKYEYEIFDKVNFEKEITDFMELFNSPPIVLILEKTSRIASQEMIEFSKKWKVAWIVFASDYAHELDDEILNSCRVSSELRLFCKTPAKMETTLPFAFDRLRITHGKWIRIDHITNLFMSCKELILENCAFEADDFTVLIQKWLENSNLQYIQIDCTRPVFQKVFENPCFPATILNNYIIDGIARRADDGDCFLLHTSHGNDHKKAIIFFGSRVNFVMRTDFEL